MRNSLFALAFALLAGSAAAAELVESIVARVNDQPITHSEFEKRCDAELRGMEAGANLLEARGRVLNEMIQERLLAERAKDDSIQATDAEVEEAVERVKRQYNLATDAEFETALAQSKMTRKDLEKQLRQTITLQKVVGREVTSRIDMSDDTLRLEYERRKEQLYRMPEQARVAEIVIRFPADDPAARQAAVGKMEEAQRKIKAGAAFADIAREYSEGNARDRGGDLGMVARGELLPALDAAVFSDPPQEYPAPALLPGSVHLFHVTERKPAGYKPFAEVREDLKKRIGESLYEKRYAEFVEKLRHQAFVKIYDPDLAKAEQKAEKKAS